MTRNAVAVVLADVVERADVRMGQLRNRLGLAIEPLAECGSAARPAAGLDRDGAIEPRVARLVDFAHTARPEGRKDFMGRDARQRERKPGGIVASIISDLEIWKCGNVGKSVDFHNSHICRFPNRSREPLLFVGRAVLRSCLMPRSMRSASSRSACSDRSVVCASCTFSVSRVKLSIT